jgi:DNA-binding MarR family transcriptional regulator
MVHAIVDEMSAWKPRERMGMFRRWLKGSLSIVHLHVLTILEDDGPLPMSRLADALDVSVASATGIVDRMEARGLVERRHAADDRRVVVVHPTADGLAVFTDLESQRRSMLAMTLAGLTNEELKGFLVGLRAMARARAQLTITESPTSPIVAVHARPPAEAKP